MEFLIKEDFFISGYYLLECNLLKLLANLLLDNFPIPGYTVSSEQLNQFPLAYSSSNFPAESHRNQCCERQISFSSLLESVDSAGLFFTLNLLELCFSI